MSRGNVWWDRWFLGLCEYTASASKDPSTKVGSVIVRPDRTVASVGYNGFPRGVEDSPALLGDRAQKYPRMVHAEMNAILAAHERLAGYTLYVHPFWPCPSCAGAIIQAGIKRVVTQRGVIPEQWREPFEISLDMLKQASVELALLEKAP